MVLTLQSLSFFANVEVTRVIPVLISATGFPPVLVVTMRYLNEITHSTVADYVQYHYLSFSRTALHSIDTALPILVAGSLFEHETIFFLLSPQKLLPWQHQDQSKTISEKSILPRVRPDAPINYCLHSHSFLHPTSLFFLHN